MFRAPTSASLLAVYVGTGSQLLGMAFVTMIFAVLGFLSPANRGGLMTAMLLLFAFMGIVGGYFSGRLYKRFKVRCRTPSASHMHASTTLSCEGKCKCVAILFSPTSVGFDSGRVTGSIVSKANTIDNTLKLQWTLRSSKGHRWLITVNWTCRVTSGRRRR